MFKERIFRKEITIDNFRLVPKEELVMGNKLGKGRPSKQEAEVISQVFYTPRGYACEIDYYVPLDTWKPEQFARIEGISNDNPEGDLTEKFFDTQLAAMHFVTRRLKRLGWEPLDNWHNT